ncbi:MAG: LamG domain-containing protein [Planctomycetota bacterium]
MPLTRPRPSRTRLQARRRPNPHPHPQERGTIYILVIVALVTGSILATSFLVAQRTATATAANFPSHTSARGVAESGMALALNYLQTSETWRDDQTPGVWITNQALAGGTFSVSVADDTNDFTDDTSAPVNVAVTGTVNGVTHIVYAAVTANATPRNTDLLFIANSASSYDSYDQAKIDLFEGWGYTVTVAAQTDSAADLTAAAEANDVVYISESVASGTVNTKIRDVATGIVCEEGFLLDDFNVSTSGSGSSSEDEINVTVDSHPVTAGFSTGTLQLSSSNQGMRTYSNLASGAETLALSTGGAAILVVVDTGATLHTGTATGRRVFTPHGQTNWDPDTLTSNGQTLIRQAIEWAAGGAPTNRLLFVTDSATAYGTSDQKKIDLFAGWGYLVIVADDNDTQATLTASADAANVVYICESASASTLGTKLRDITTGVVSSQEQAVANFRLASGNSTTSGTALDITNNTHSITNGLSTGSTPISGSSFTLSRYTGLASGVTTLATSGTSGDAGLILAELGSALTSGTAPGRRVFTPFGQTDWDPDNTNATVDTLLRQALDWADDNVSAGGNIQTLALYEFNEPTPITPTLVSRWALDDTAGGGATPPGDANTFGVSVANQISLSGGSIINSYDSTVGTYSATNGNNAIVTTNSTSSGRIGGSGQVRGDAYSGVGSTASSVITASTTGSKNTLSVNKDMTDVAAPTGMPGSSGNRSVSSGSTTTISSDVTYNDFQITNAARVNISGDVRILVNGDFLLSDASEVRLNGGASLKLYVQGKFEIKNGSEFNDDTRRAGDAEIYVLGNSDPLLIDDGSDVAAIINSRANLEIKNGSRIYGLVRSQGSISMQDGSDIHMDRGIFGLTTVTVTDSTGVSSGSLNDNPTSGAGGFGDGGTSFQFDGSNDFIEVPHNAAYLLDQGALSFWFRSDDTSGVQGLVSKDSKDYDDGGQLDIRLSGSNLQARIQSTTTSYTRTHSVIAANTWYHVAVTWGPDGFHLYINGTLSGSHAYTGGLGTSSGGSGNANPWTFGVDQQQSGDNTSSGWQNPFAGRLDDIRLYGNQLDATQAANLAAGSAPGNSTDYTVYDTSGYGTPYNLASEDPANVSWTADGMRINTGTVITSTVAADKIRTGLQATGEFTFLFTFSVDSVTTPGDQDVFSVESPTDPDWIEYELRQDDVNIKIQTSSGLSWNTVYNTISTSKTQVLLSYDGSNIKLYQNGVLINEWPHTGDLSGLPSDMRLYVGRDGPGAASEYFLGVIHSVAVYDQAFDPINASLVFNGEDPNYTPEEVDYQAVWIETSAP